MTGTVIILLVLALLLPLTVPRFLGYRVYNVVSGSMEPAIPRGSIVLVRPESWSEIREGDVIAFGRAESVVTHRVIEVRSSDMEFITKGDANEEADMQAVPFASLIGRVERYYPSVGAIAAVVSSPQGKLYLLAVLSAGVLLCYAGSRLKQTKERE